MKIYPAILIVMFIKDWRDWKGNIRRMTGLLFFNIALLFVLGPNLFKDFLAAVKGQQGFAAASTVSHALKGYVAYLTYEGWKFLSSSAVSMIRQYQGQMELLLLAVLVLCFLLVLFSSYRQGRPGLNANLLVISTICAMVIPSISNNYKLPILTAPMAILWCSMTLPAQGWRKVLSILLLIMTSVAYWSIQYPPRMKPLVVSHNFPALFAIAIMATVLTFVAPRNPTVSPDSHTDGLA